MKITHQDIIDKEFRVKFRGFDMAEVDTFLEEVAEKFFKLSEENTRLNEKILALKEDIESADRESSQGPIELPAEMVNFLEELKQDTAAINAEIVALKQDRSTFLSLDKNIKEAAASLQKTAAITPPQAPADHGNLSEALDGLRKSTEALSGELADFKQETGSIQQIREGIKSELEELLKSHFNAFEKKFSQAPPVAAQAEPGARVSAAGEKEELLAAAIIEEEPAGLKEDAGLPGFEEQDDTYDDDLEFLSEDDILDVDKLRGVFQSVLDNSVSDTPNSREVEDDSSSDLLFLEDILEEEHEPEVTFSLEEAGAGKKSKKEAGA